MVSYPVVLPSGQSTFLLPHTFYKARLSVPDPQYNLVWQGTQEDLLGQKGNLHFSAPSSLHIFKVASKYLEGSALRSYNVLPLLGLPGMTIFSISEQTSGTCSHLPRKAELTIFQASGLQFGIPGKEPVAYIVHDDSGHLCQRFKKTQPCNIYLAWVSSSSLYTPWVLTLPVWYKPPW